MLKIATAPKIVKGLRGEDRAEGSGRRWKTVERLAVLLER